MVKLLIIADDLSGAIDAGVQLAKQCIPALVITGSKVNLAFRILLKKYEVLIVNTESRHINPRVAALRIRRIVKSAVQYGVRYFYKKTDSTMRGNIGAELEAFIQSTGRSSLPYIPGHPKLKRFTKKGYQYVGKRLLHQTRFAEDPIEPMLISSVPDILRKQTRLNITQIFRNKLNTKIIRPSGGNEIIIFDCCSEKDLRKIGEHLVSRKIHTAVAGTAGFVEILPSLFNLKPINKKSLKISGPALIVNGSLNNVSLQQVKYAETRGVKAISIPGQIFKLGSFPENEIKRLQQLLKYEIEPGRDVIINSTNLDKKILEYGNHNLSGIHKSKTHETVAKLIGIAVAALLKVSKFRCLVIFGGDTLSGVMHALKCESILPVREILPGVALSIIEVRNNNLYLITKPGGYGEKDVILKIINHITNIQ